MNRTPKNIFLHFLNKDTQEIYGMGPQALQVVIERLRKGLNASVLLCDAETFCFLPLGFWFESPYTRALLSQSCEFISDGFVRFSIREEDLQIFIEKKQQQYAPFCKTAGPYQDFFEDAVLRSLELLPPVFIKRWAKIGEECSTIWTADHNLLLGDNNGDLKEIYDIIPDMDAKEKIAKSVLGAAGFPNRPFVWKSVRDIITSLPVRDGRLEQRLRLYFERNYYDVYLKEYDATNLFRFYLIDQGISFHLKMPEDSIANYLWFETFLGQLELDAVLSAPAWNIVKIRRSSSWTDLQEAYIKACNDSRQIGPACTASIRQSEPEIKRAVEAVKEILIMSKGEIFMLPQKKTTLYVPKQEKVDVLIIVATIDEEQAITQNTEWESRETTKGYEYFVRKEGPLLIALARSIEMGRESAAIVAQFFVEELNPRFLAMAGFCAGKRGSVQLGDVIVPFKVYRYGDGKQISATETLPEINSFRLDDRWKQKIERFGNDWRKNVKLPRPVTYESQYYFLLRALVNNEFCAEVRTLRSNQGTPNIMQIIEEEIKCKRLTLNGGTVVATKEGEEKYNHDFLFQYTDEYKDPELELKVGVLATGDCVQAWDGIFQILEKQADRKTCVLDMEGSAIADVSSFNRIPYIIAKGVGDFASETKAFDNRYIAYAVFSAYQFLVEFFQNLPPTLNQ